MDSVSTYLNFKGCTGEAFEFYKNVFRSEYLGSIMRYGDLPPEEGMRELSEEEKSKVVNVALPILGGHILMGSDSIEGFGPPFVQGNHMHIMLGPQTREEMRRLYRELGEGGTVIMELQDMFWGDYYGQVKDRYGVSWMLNCSEKAGADGN